VRTKKRILKYISVYDETMSLGNDLNNKDIYNFNQISLRIKPDINITDLLDKESQEKVIHHRQSEFQTIRRMELSNIFKDLEYYSLLDSNRVINDYYSKIPIIYRVTIIFGLLIVASVYEFRSVIGSPFTFMGLIGGLGILFVAIIGSLEIKYNNLDADILYYRIVFEVHEKVSDVLTYIRELVNNAGFYCKSKADLDWLRHR
jgi:hypothetical protein